MVSITARHDLAQRDIHPTAAIATFELGADIAPIRWTLSQIDVLVHAAAPAEAGQLVAVAKQIAESLERDSVVHGRSIAPTRYTRNQSQSCGTRKEAVSAWTDLACVVAVVTNSKAVFVTPVIEPVTKIRIAVDLERIAIIGSAIECKGGISSEYLLAALRGKTSFRVIGLSCVPMCMHFRSRSCHSPATAFDKISMELFFKWLVRPLKCDLRIESGGLSAIGNYYGELKPPCAAIVRYAGGRAEIRSGLPLITSSGFSECGQKQKSGSGGYHSGDHAGPGRCSLSEVVLQEKPFPRPRRISAFVCWSVLIGLLCGWFTRRLANVRDNGLIAGFGLCFDWA